MSAGKVGSGRVAEMWDLGECRKGGILASTEKVGSGRVPKGGIRARCQKGGIRGELERWDLGKMLENPKQAKQSKQTQGKGVDLSMTSRVCQQMTQISQKSNTIMIKKVGIP